LGNIEVVYDTIEVPVYCGEEVVDGQTQPIIQNKTVAVAALPTPSPATGEMIRIDNEPNCRPTVVTMILWDDVQNPTYIASIAVQVYGEQFDRVIPVNHTTAVHQYHTGDIYIDCPEVIEPTPDDPTEPSEPSEYAGPFKVETWFASMEEGSEEDPVATVNIVGVGEPPGDGVKYAGRIFLNGVLAKSPNEWLQVAQITPSGSTADGFVYLYIPLQVSDTAEAIDGYIVGTPTPEFSLRSVQQTATTRTYIVRLAKLVEDEEGNLSAIQIHYGDIYIDTQYIDTTEPPPPPPTYSGPFQITANGVAQQCPGCPPNVVGYFSVNGDGVYTAVTGNVNVSANGTTQVWLQVTGATTGSLATQACQTPACYSVWLGSIVNGAPIQMHYGNVQVDGRWS
jgi:hypothetical protein